MLYTYLIYYIAIECSAFHEFAAICSCVVVALTFVFTYIHAMSEETEAQRNRKHWLLLMCKVANVTCTILGFIQIFNADMYFDIGEDIAAYAAVKGVDLKKIGK